MKRYGIEVRNCSGTTIYNLGEHPTREHAFEAAKKGYKWFAKEPNINQIIERRN